MPNIFVFAIVILTSNGVTTFDYTGTWNNCKAVAVSLTTLDRTAYCKPKDDHAFQEWLTHGGN